MRLCHRIENETEHVKMLFRVCHLHTRRVYLALTIGPRYMAAGFAAMRHALDQVLDQVLPADSKLHSEVLDPWISKGTHGDCCKKINI